MHSALGPNFICLVLALALVLMLPLRLCAARVIRLLAHKAAGAPPAVYDLPAAATAAGGSASFSIFSAKFPSFERTGKHLRNRPSIGLLLRFVTTQYCAFFT